MTRLDDGRKCNLRCSEVWLTELLTAAGGGGAERGNLQCSQWRERKQDVLRHGRPDIRPEEESNKAADLQQKNDERLKWLDTVGWGGQRRGKDGGAVQSVTQVGCEMSGLSFGHG